MKIIVGQGSCGIAAGANKVYTAIEEEINKRNLKIDLKLTGCIGMCYLEPIVEVIDDNGKKETYVKVLPEAVDEMMEKIFNKDSKFDRFRISIEDEAGLYKQERIALRNCGKINPESIDEYIAAGGYGSIQRLVVNMNPDEVIEEIKISGLRGRGGAGFPTWFKWRAAADAIVSPKYIICNADEGDPGAFMDRSILEGDPHSLIEGMIIGGYAIGAKEGIIYVRAEYPLAIQRLRRAIDEARRRKYLGKNIFNKKDFDFDLRIKAGAGAFVCGEETALIASLEGERGMPRLKPPFPAEKGYWQNPSNINNVETFANIPWIMANGGEEFVKIGTNGSKGTKVFALTGKVKKGGLVEVPMGITLREIIFDIGGGIKEDKPFKAVQMGGPSGGCIPYDLLDTKVDYDSITKTGAIMGSGGMVVMDESTCMVEMARFFLDFTGRESCGKCVYCRIGTMRMLEILTRICEGQGQEGDIELLEELGENIKSGSLCGLGQTAPNPVLSTLKYFREEYEQHIYEKKCPAKQCKPLLTYTIVKEKCIGCGLCLKNCPTGAITGQKKEDHIINKSLCIQCGKCQGICKFHAIDVQ